MANSSSSHARFLALLTAAALCAAPEHLEAQTGYYHLDASRPIRIEDASVVERFALEIEAPSIRADRTSDGIYRYRTEPHVSYGVLPRTQIEIGAPMEYRDAPGRSFGGLVGISVAGMHSFNNESRMIPALALWTGVRLPVGALSSKTTRVGVKGIATRTFSRVRLHVNAEYSTALAKSSCTPTPDTTCPPPAPPDQFQDTGNCFRISPASFSCAAAPDAIASAAASARQSAAAAPASPTRGRWTGGAALDHAFPLHSVLVALGVFVERDARAGAPLDWTGEAGARLQLTPRTVLDGGIGRHFSGADQSWFVVTGLSFELGVPRWMRGS